MRTLAVDYNCDSIFKISSKIPLLSVEDNKNCTGVTKVPWSWWVKWDRLHYYDIKGNEKIIEPYSSGSMMRDFKYPIEGSETFEEDGDDESDYESDATPIVKRKRPQVAKYDESIQ